MTRNFFINSSHIYKRNTGVDDADSHYFDDYFNIASINYKIDETEKRSDGGIIDDRSKRKGWKKWN